MRHSRSMTQGGDDGSIHKERKATILLITLSSLYFVFICPPGVLQCYITVLAVSPIFANFFKHYMYASYIGAILWILQHLSMLVYALNWLLYFKDVDFLRHTLRTWCGKPADEKTSSKTEMSTTGV